LEKRHEFGTRIWVLFGIICLQALIILLNGYLSYQVLNQQKQFCGTTLLTIFIISALLYGVVAAYLIREINRFSKIEMELSVNQVLLDKSQDLVSVLRNHRHDFRNHLQVILGLIQLGRESGAVDYIKEVTLQLGEQAEMTHKIKSLETSALLFTKKALAEARKIDLHLKLETDLANLVIPATDLVRILGNLIDNAFDAVLDLDDDYIREVWVRFQETPEQYIITVFNRLPIIFPEMQQKIFLKGFTTKGAGGSGLGLAIVKELTEKHGGQISLESEIGTGTTFTLTFPKSEE